MENLTHANRNAEADESIVIYASKKRLAKNPAMKLTITVLLHKMDDSKWTKDELSPIKEFKVLDVKPASPSLGAEIILSDNNESEVYFEESDGKKGVSWNFFNPIQIVQLV